MSLIENINKLPLELENLISSYVPKKLPLELEMFSYYRVDNDPDCMLFIVPTGDMVKIYMCDMEDEFPTLIEKSGLLDYIKFLMRQSCYYDENTFEDDRENIRFRIGRKDDWISTQNEDFNEIILLALKIIENGVYE
jgi:hypothetical protein